MTIGESAGAGGPSWPLYVCGSIIGASMVGVLLAGRPTGSPGFLACAAVASVSYLAALALLCRSTPPVRPALIVCLILGGLWRLPLLLPPPGALDDVFRYLWDARLQRLGYSPYQIVPNSPAASPLHTAQTRRMNNPEVPTPYPPGAQYFFRLVTSASGSVRAFRMAALLCDGLIVMVLLAWLRDAGISKWWVLIYAWNPLVTLEGAWNGHLDLAGTLVLVVAFLALSRGRTMCAALAFSLAISIKLLPLVLAPLFWRRIRPRDAVAGAALLVVLYVPFVTPATVPWGSLGVFIDRFRFNDPVFKGMETLAAPRVVAGLAVAVGLAVAAWMRARRRTDDPSAWAWPMAAALLFAPVIYPWYLLWLTPFLVRSTAAPLLVWTLSVTATNIVWFRAASGAPWVVPSRALLIEFGAVAVAAMITVARRGARATDV